MEQEILKEIQAFTKEKVTISSNIRDLKIDSLDLVELVVKAEEKFNISISDEEITKLISVSDFIELVKQRSNK
ncbi:phosphopantetheine-binding protein [Mycoplasma phocimorsus]|uniref:Phosphopantetheine-binding protein n=1 Tax=Mycoplasma phocimorsus TaxID=3045839 RepID=A0AAJ1UWJ1_9MOLU|nr:phosphopantetheine-binding protein [Mycoplasma phocimorsus]MDJ1645495.1 phosphopantetheine-binding protein [Mycoplasma phocimorsus]MDJ1646456.1 phosphopantetheine-binding protein [Mycoplasma phocimorsus]MDJ1646980.1 phosphopantetheine-binding protein [Mycoplasma phocimorsus]MDJ1647426.1 phosphopantetheine-binding protein [Mycoplasma phocimorsus]MDJ1647938.1 phosphopantetheine-binding protein [Mycoplasma phocimorsus]